MFPDILFFLDPPYLFQPDHQVSYTSEAGSELFRTSSITQPFSVKISPGCLNGARSNSHVEAQGGAYFEAQGGHIVESCLFGVVIWWLR